MKDLGEAAYIVGIKIYMDRSRGLIGLCQNIYLDKILRKFNMEESKKGFILMQHGMVLSKTQCPSTSKELDRMSRVPYVSDIGLIMYSMICISPNIPYVVSMTSPYQANPEDEL